MNSYEKTALYGPPKVGADILTFCSRCKIELAHVIVSMVDGTPVKVICKTCRSEHKYKKTAGASVGKTRKTPTARASKSTIRLADLWEKRISESKAVVPQKYTIQELFKKNDLLEHIKFGLGVVEEVLGSGKVRVLFKDEERVLIHGKK